MAAIIHIGFVDHKSLPKVTEKPESMIAFLAAALILVEEGKQIALSMNGNIQDWDIDEPGSKTIPFEHESGVIRIFLRFYGVYNPEGHTVWHDRVKAMLRALITSDILKLVDNISDDDEGYRVRHIVFEG